MSDNKILVNEAIAEWCIKTAPQHKGHIAIVPKLIIYDEIVPHKSTKTRMKITEALKKLDTSAGKCKFDKILVPKSLAKEILKVDQRFKLILKIID